MPRESCCSFPLKRYRSRHALVPFGRIDRVNPPPSASLLGLGPGLAFLIVVSVSDMCGQRLHVWRCLSIVAHYVARKQRGCQWKTKDAPGPLIAKTTINTGVLCMIWIVLDVDGRKYGGGTGIRTQGTLSRSTVFKTAAFNRSAIPPKPARPSQDHRPALRSRLNHLLAAHVLTQDLRDHDRTVALLVVLEDRDQRTADSHARPV